MKDFGVRVFVKKHKEHGYIIRRLDSQNYQILLDSQLEIFIGPDEFVEIKKENEDE